MLTTEITRLPPMDIDYEKCPIGNSGAFFCYTALQLFDEAFGYHGLST